MVKLEVGMYVRTNKGEITKIINARHYKNETGEYDYFVTDKEIKQSLYSDLPNSNVIKASYNIIDLIEERDVIVDHICNKYEVIQTYSPEGKYTIWIKLSNDTFIENIEDIKSIVTHEQFEIMKYEVE